MHAGDGVEVDELERLGKGGAALGRRLLAEHGHQVGQVEHAAVHVGVAEELEAQRLESNAKVKEIHDKYEALERSTRVLREFQSKKDEHDALAAPRRVARAHEERREHGAALMSGARAPGTLLHEAAF